jgi:hypothetical protein
MKIVVFGDQKRVGALVGGNVVDLNRADSSLSADLLGDVRGGPVPQEGRRGGSVVPHDRNLAEPNRLAAAMISEVFAQPALPRSLDLC